MTGDIVVPATAVEQLFMSVIVVAYNEERTIATALQSIQLAIRQSACNVELIVVLTGCTDNTESEVYRVAKGIPTVRVFSKAERLSKSDALNLGASLAVGEILLFFDADLSFDRHSISRIQDAFSKDGSLDLAFGRMIPLSGPSWWWSKVGQWTADVLNAIRGEQTGCGLWLVCGPLFAIRAGAWQPLPKGLISDDLYVGCHARERHLHIKYLPCVFAYGRYPQTLSDYLSQKLRNRSARIQLRTLFREECGAVPMWLAPFGIRCLGWATFRYIPILLIDVLLTIIALFQWSIGKRQTALWTPASSTKRQ